ncbi:hypothetical protein NEOLI_001772 [Neolecta irregularis DAH-3]|uniref:Uncharacterized protein n=1 Tax=Neolecta irregularis (strain DAH-3) TaxID=1198029 RepID=A0A1U7LIE5_NEOID|nr:hypothetical protein NEOLI_001772 [Neolecta irregularis DAH-3]|eukprot:OLL22425.1 hypothetical protein NEOLI_001772 [Neolecta irregularis DAH-3]
MSATQTNVTSRIISSLNNVSLLKSINSQLCTKSSDVQTSDGSISKEKALRDRVLDEWSEQEEYGSWDECDTYFPHYCEPSKDCRCCPLSAEKKYA